MKPFIETNIQSVEFNDLPVHHGDVIIEQMDALPNSWYDWPIVEDGCIAYGEATGHAHKLFGDDFQVRENPDTKERYFVSGNVITLKHQEHNPMMFKGSPDAPVIARTRIAKEYDHFEELVRSVVD